MGIVKRLTDCIFLKWFFRYGWMQPKSKVLKRFCKMKGCNLTFDIFPVYLREIECA